MAAARCPAPPTKPVFLLRVSVSVPQKTAVDTGDILLGGTSLLLLCCSSCTQAVDECTEPLEGKKK
jgi:hypothetical protein